MLFFTRHRETVIRAALHPYALGPLVLCLWSLLTMPLQMIPVRHFLGSAHIGEGSALWAGWAMMIAAVLILRQTRIFKYVVVVAGLVAFAILYGMLMNFRWRGELLTPLYFPDFLSLSIFGILPVLFWLFEKSVQGQQALRFFIWPVLLAVLVGLNIFTENNVGVAYSAAGVAFFLGVFALPIARQKQERYALWTLAAIPAGFLILLIVSVQIYPREGYYATHDWGALTTIFSRGYLIDMVWQPMFERPLSWLIGLGWGSYGEIVSGYLPTGWVDFTGEKGVWDGVSTDHFHSHNLFVDVLYSAGLPALLIFTAWIVTIPLFARRGQKICAFVFAGALAGIGSFWFIMPHNIGFITLGLGFLGRPLALRPVLRRHPKMLERAVLFVLMLCITCGVLAVCGIVRAMRTTDQYTPPAFAKAGDYTSCTLDYNDYGAGGVHLARMMTLRLRVITTRWENKEDADDEKKLKDELKGDLVGLTHLFCQADLYRKAHPASEKLAIARLLVRGETLLSAAALMDKPLQNHLAQGWEEELDVWLDRHPARVDLAVPYLLWSLLQHQEEAMNRMAQRLYAHNPQDPVGLWFTGLAMTGSDATAQEGVWRMRRALDFGITRFMPIEDEIKVQLGVEDQKSSFSNTE
ncbi:MAG: hypothetical protein L6Q57_03800 [Alphaproteobacteria bacterium]|nr:hypothetical protein [Alphaproteobacteria bacterium]